MPRFMKRRRREGFSRIEDPLTGVANLFDLAIVIIVGLMMALLVAFHMTDIFKSDTEITIFKKSKGKVEIIVKKGKTIKAYRATGSTVKGEVGERIGSAYRLKDGRIVYVPE